MPPRGYKKPKVGEIVKTPLGPDPKSPAKEVIKTDEAMESLYVKLEGQITSAMEQRSGWEQKRDMYHKMRMRIRKDKTFPFPGCSNLRMPTIEKYIRKQKSGIINMLWGSKPRALVNAKPNGNPDAAYKLEYYLDHLIEDVIKPLRNLVILSDKVEEQGFGFMEVIWKMEDECRKFKISLDELPEEIVKLVFSINEDDALIPVLAKIFDIDMSETVRYQNEESLRKALSDFREGKKESEIKIYDETYNNPDWVIHDPQYVHAPADSYLDPQKARFIAVEVYEPWDVVRRKADEGIYDKDSISEIDAIRMMDPEKVTAGRSLFRTTEATKDLREGIERLNNPSATLKLYRVYAWHDLDGDGVEERNVFIMAPEFKKILKKFPYKYAFKKWPIVRFDAEITDDRWYSSRGLPELLEDMVKEIDTQHNQKIDQQTIRNTPMFAFRSGVVNPRLIKFIPGQAIPVPGTIPLNDAISVLRNESSNAEFSYRDEQLLLESQIQEVVGHVDYSLQSQINRREPRTAFEASAQQQAANSVFGLDTMLFSESMSEALDMTVKLLQQYLPDEVYFSVSGEGVSIHLTRDEIQGGYSVRVRANDFTMNSGQRVAMQLNRAQFLMQPQFLQSGMITPQNLFYIAKEYLQATGDFTWKTKISLPQPQPASPPPPITQIKPSFEDLTDAEKAQVLHSGGVEPDMMGRALNKNQEIAQEMENSGG